MASNLFEDEAYRAAARLARAGFVCAALEAFDEEAANELLFLLRALVRLPRELPRAAAELRPPRANAARPRVRAEGASRTGSVTHNAWPARRLALANPFQRRRSSVLTLNRSATVTSVSPRRGV